MTDREVMQMALDWFHWFQHGTNPNGAHVLEVEEALRAALAQPESLLNSVHCQCGASWTYENGALNYKPFKDENK